MTIRAKRGTARLIERNGRYRVRFPKALFNGADKQLCLEIEANDLNLPIAEALLQLINSDISLQRFDPSLERYQPQHKQKAYQMELEKLKPSTALIALWLEYEEYKRSQLKATTVNYYQKTLRPLIARCPHQDPKQALAVRAWLIDASPSLSMAKRILTNLSACIDWAILHKLIDLDINPYQGMSKEFKHQYELQNDKALAFTPIEQQALIHAFRHHKNPHGGFNYQPYALFVEFLFLTGCRPSEAIGLTWGQIGRQSIKFDRSIVWSQGEKIESAGSKNNRVRSFPITPELSILLKRLGKPESSEELLFKSPQGKVIDYKNFSNRAWNALADPIKRGTTPYSARDTFITNQIREGKPIALIAKWCDTSTQMIERYYLDSHSISDIMPS